MPTNLLTGETIGAVKRKGVNLLPELTGVYKDSEGSTTLPEVSRREPLIQDLSNAFMSGLSRLWATSARIPAAVYDLAAIPQNFLMKSLGKKELQVQSPEWLMDNPIAELYDYQTELFRKDISPTKTFEQAFETKDFDGIGRHLAIQVVENVPQQIGIILSFMAGYPNMGITGMGVLETAHSLKEARKKKKDPAMSAYNALAKGVIEAGFESIGTMGILRKWSRTLTTSFGTKNATQIMGDIFKTVFHSILGEGNEEFWTSLAQDFSDFTTGINKDALKGTLTRAFEAGVVGGISGGLLTGPGAIRLGYSSASLNKMKANVEQVRKTLEEEARPVEVEPAPEVPPRVAIEPEIPPVRPPERPVEVIPPEVRLPDVIPEDIVIEEAERPPVTEIARVREIVEIAAKKKIQTIHRAVREGRITTKKEIKANQTKIINLIEESKLEAKDKAKFIRTIKNVQTRVDLERALPEITERVAKLAERAEKETFVREITRFARVKVDPDYREQIDEILETFDLKRRTEITKRRRQKKAEFVERQREEGNIDFLPADFFTDFGKKTLDEMTMGEVEQLRDQIKVLATVGATKNRLLAIRGERDFHARLNKIINTLYDTVGKTEQVEGKVIPLVRPAERGLVEEKLDQIDAYFAMHRKIEFITLALKINNDIFETMQDGINKELVKGEEAYEQVKDAFALISKDLNKMIKEEIEIEGVPVPLTRQQIVMVALNNGNPGNRQRLIDGNKFTVDQIRIIEEQLKPNERKFVDRIFEIVNSLFPDTVRVSKKLYGVKPKPIEGKYFPIVPDKELSKIAKLREAERDLFQDVFHITFVERGFTKERKGGRAPLDLSFNVIFKHIDSVIHYNSLAIPVRDIQKITKDPRFKKGITEAMSEHVYNQFPLWLRDIANPKGLQASGSMDKISQLLRHNATAAILGHRLTVSLLQGGSFTQTINEIGLPDSINGIMQFYKNPKGAIEFVYSKSPIMKNRKHRFDREIRDWLKTKEAVKITQGKKSYTEMLFELIRGVDFVTTMPTWLGTYEKNLRETDNIEESVRYADGVVRRTQPAAAMENLAAIMRGTPTQKLFTSFMTHFSNMHNQMVLAMDTLKYSKDHPMRKSINFARSMWWVWVAPAMLAGWIRSGFKVDDWRRYAQELVLYPFAGMFLIRDLMGAIIKGFDFGAPPGLAGLKELSYAFKGKKGRTKIKHGVKAFGLLTGRIPTQWVDSVDGFIDLQNETTQDFRRLIWSEAAIKPVTKGLFRKPTPQPTRPKIGR